jgi:hypothetical protein
MPTAAGVVVGVAGYHFPLTFGDGSYQARLSFLFCWALLQKKMKR